MMNDFSHFNPPLKVILLYAIGITDCIISYMFLFVNLGVTYDLATKEDSLNKIYDSTSGDSLLNFAK